MGLKRVNLRRSILFGFVALAGIGLCAQEVVEWKVTSPLVLGVEHRNQFVNLVQI